MKLRKQRFFHVFFRARVDAYTRYYYTLAKS